MSWWGILCDRVCHWLVSDRWFSPGTLISSTNKSDRHDITEILLKVTLNTKSPNSSSTYKTDRHDITEILLKVALNTITANSSPTYKTDRHDITEILLKVAFNTITLSLSCWGYYCNVYSIAENKVTLWSIMSVIKTM